MWAERPAHLRQTLNAMPCLVQWKPSISLVDEVGIQQSSSHLD